MCRIVSNDNINGVTIVPNRFIDEFMVDAGESELKVYLYLSRFLYTPGVDIAFESIAEALELTKGKVKKALNYWQDLGLLSYSEDKGNIDRIYMQPIYAMGQKSDAEKAPESESAPEKENVETLPEKTESVSPEVINRFKPEKLIEVYLPENYTDKQLNILALDALFNHIMESVEEKYYFPFQMRHDDLVVLAGVYESIGFSEEMIDHLYSYCLARKNDNMSQKAFTNYVRKVAVGWAEKGIKTPEEQMESEQYIGRLYSEIVKVLGLRRDRMPKAQNEEINKWIFEYRLPGDVILTACSRAVDAEVDKPFGYTKKVLEEWHEKEVKSLEDVEKLDKKHKDSTEKEKKGRKQQNSGFLDYKYKKMTSEENDALVAKLIKKNERPADSAKLEERLANYKK